MPALLQALARSSASWLADRSADEARRVADAAARDADGRTMSQPATRRPGRRRRSRPCVPPRPRASPDMCRRSWCSHRGAWTVGRPLWPSTGSGHGGCATAEPLADRGANAARRRGPSRARNADGSDCRLPTEVEWLWSGVKGGRPCPTRISPVGPMPCSKRSMRSSARRRSDIGRRTGVRCSEPWPMRQTHIVEGSSGSPPSRNQSRRDARSHPTTRRTAHPTPDQPVDSTCPPRLPRRCRGKARSRETRARRSDPAQPTAPDAPSRRG